MVDTPRTGLKSVPPEGTMYSEPEPEEPARKGPRRRITRPSHVIELREGSPVGEYEIQAQIGEGGMGTVYNAIHPLIGKRVAIKVLKAELCSNQASINRFIQEAQAVNKIGHPNIVDVFSLGELPDGRAFFVMEWLRGEDLKGRLKRGPMPVLEACDILDGIARALDAAHAKDIVHRDLKPDNVFLHQIESTGPFQVKLLDFGIAKLLTKGDQEQTATGNILGTPKYISPEQARGIDVDHRSDIYSLGVMAYEMLAGQPPFQGETAMDLVVKHLHEPAPQLSQFARVPRALEQCVMRMLEKEPAKRPSLAEVRTILIDPQRRITPLPMQRASMSGFMPQSRRWPMVVGAFVLVAVAGVIVWQVSRSATPGTPMAAAAPAPVTVPSGKPAVPDEPPKVLTVAPNMLEIEIKGSQDSEIFVDGTRAGIGRISSVRVEAGNHEIEVRPPGQAPIKQLVVVEQGVDQTVKIDVPPPVKPVVVKPVVKPTSGGPVVTKPVVVKPVIPEKQQVVIPVKPKSTDPDPDALMKPKVHK